MTEQVRLLFAAKIDPAERASKARAAGEVADFHNPLVGRRTMITQEKILSRVSAEGIGPLNELALRA